MGSHVNSSAKIQPIAHISVNKSKEFIIRIRTDDILRGTFD